MIARDEAYGRSADVCELGVHLPCDLLHPSPSVPVTFELDCGDSGIDIQQLATQRRQFHGYHVPNLRHPRCEPSSCATSHTRAMILRNFLAERLHEFEL